MTRRGCLTGGAFSLLITALGCASPPPQALEQARARYAEAAADASVQANAGVELYEAQEALTRAENSWRRDDEEAEIAHRSALAELRVAVAEEAAARRTYETRAEELSSKRTSVRLAARDAEIASAEAAAAAESIRADVAAGQAADATRRADLAEAKIAGLEELAIQQTERGIVVTLDDVLFASGRADLQPGAQRSLDRVADFLEAHPERNVAVEGHTDDVGADGYNQQLSEQRARAVADYLRSRGIAGGRVTSVGFGETRPLVANESASARQQNRRVEVVIGEP